VERSGTILRAERAFDGDQVVRHYAIKFDEAVSLDGIDLG
jgi:hypothetical protein